MYHRIIAKLDIKGPNLVKGIHLEGLRVLGKPETFARYYYEQGADELMYMDVVASLYNRNSIHELISRTAKEVFIPLTVGGGLRSIDDIRSVLRAGADKVSLNTAAIKDPQLIRQAARYFGSSTIVATIEAIKQPNGQYFAFIDNGREETGIEVAEWAQRVTELGAGEIVLTSVDREGTGEGFDIELTKKISDLVGIPVIACGGAGKPVHVRDVLQNGHADAVAIASMFHYDFVHRQNDQGHHESEGNNEFLKNKRRSGKIDATGLSELKAYLKSEKIPCRTTE